MQKLTKWGNSTGVRLNVSILEAAGLRPGDYVHVRLLDCGEIRLKPASGVQPAEAGQGQAVLPPKVYNEETW